MLVVPSRSAASATNGKRRREGETNTNRRVLLYLRVSSGLMHWEGQGRTLHPVAGIVQPGCAVWPARPTRRAGEERSTPATAAFGQHDAGRYWGGTGRTTGHGGRPFLSSAYPH